MSRLLYVTCLIACFAFISGCSDRKTESVPDEGLARVGDTVIRVEDFQNEALRRQRAGQPVPDKETILQDMVSFEAMLQRARREGLDRDPAVRRELDRVLVSRLQERELLPRLEKGAPGEAEVKAEYERDAAKYTQPRLVRLSGLVLDVPKGASEARRAEARKRLVEAREKILKNPAPGGRGPAAQGFGALAVDCTDDPVSRHRGGDLGWLKDGARLSRWPAAVVDAGFSLERGAVSEVIEAEGGFYLVMKTDERPSVVTPLERVHAAIAQSLKVRKDREIRSAYLQDVLNQAGVEIRSSRLAEVEFPKEVTQKKNNVTSRPPGLPNVN